MINVNVISQSDQKIFIERTLANDTEMSKNSFTSFKSYGNFPYGVFHQHIYPMDIVLKDRELVEPNVQ